MRKRYVSAAAMALWCLSGMCPALAGNAAGPETPRTITVYGEASQNFSPDQAEITLGVQTQGKTVAEAAGDNARKMANVVHALSQAGVSPQQIQTRAFTVSPKYAPRTANGYDPAEMRKVTGYAAENSLTVSLNDPEKVAGVIDAATTAGANTVSDICFSLKHAGMLGDQVFAEAVANAVRRAGAMARAAHVTPGQVLRIQDAAVEDTGRERVMLSGARKSVTTTIRPGKITLSAKVLVRMSLE